jgi:probable HAF family extracellular repeat protein
MAYLRRFAFSLLLLLCVPLIHAQSNAVIPNANLTFTTIDVPGAGITNVLGINSAGSTTGNYAEAIGSPSRGFSFADGNFTLFDYPGGDDTVPVGINDSDLISGSSFIRNYTAIVSFLYDGNSFTTIRAPGKSVTDAQGINNAGVIVGGDGSTGATRGFARVGTHFNDISPPGNYIFIFGNGVNNLGQIVGTADDTGFFYGHGMFKTLAVPGASATQPRGINDSGIIVGWYAGASFTGFALLKGKYLKIKYPGAIYTFASGINNSGQIVGSYSIDQQTYHGFVTSPITAADFE